MRRLAAVLVISLVSYVLLIYHNTDLIWFFLDTLVAQKGFYGQDFGWGFGLLLALTTQCAGYGIAGICRKLLVEPSSMIWPRNLVNCAFMWVKSRSIYVECRDVLSLDH